MSESSVVTSPKWYHALTLQERAKSLPKSHQLPLTDAAKGQLQKWQTQAPFDRNDYFAKRLAVDGLDEVQLAYLLSEPIEMVRDRLSEPPEWLAELLEAFDPTRMPYPLPTCLQQGVEETFLALISPLLEQTSRRFEQGVKMMCNTYQFCPFDPETVVELFLANLADDLLPMMNPTLVTELHMARLRGNLMGQMPQERYQSFIYQLQKPEIALAILQENPVLARQLTAYLKNWLDARLEFLQHLCQDVQGIQDTLAASQELGVLVGVDDSVSDRHRHGRRVMIAQFSSGITLVYKPKSLKIDAHFQELLTWLNERCARLWFRTTSVLDCDTHGWVEFIPTQACEDESEIQRYYERMGGYLAIIYLLNGMDFHYENIIAMGEHPMLIDLEMLFQPYHYAPESTRYRNMVTHTWHSSVLATLILPVRFRSHSEKTQLDTSGIGGSGGQLRRSVLQLEGQGTDEMRFVRKSIPLKTQKNLPLLQGHPVDPLNYQDAIISGFSELYNCLQKHRENLLAEDGPILRCAGDEIRILIRNSEKYALLLRQSFQPNELRDSLPRERGFDRLWNDIVGFPRLIGAVPQEVKSLQECDICQFNTTPDAYDCWSVYGYLPDVFLQTGLDIVQQRVQRLGKQDFQKQLWFTKTALASLSIGDDPQHMTAYPITSISEAVTPASLVSLAEEVGEYLVETAVQQDGVVAWMGLDSVDRRHWFFDYSATDLHHGLPGLALFLAYLGAITGQEKYISLAQIALQTMLAELSYDKNITKIGGFSGWGGILYALSHFSALWKQPKLLTQAELLVKEVMPLIAQDTRLNLFSGAAGCIAGLLSLYHLSPSKRTLETALHCGDWLCQQMKTTVVQTEAQTAASPPPPDVGFAYGLAGMAWALLKLYEQSGAIRFLAAAKSALAYCDHASQRLSYQATDHFVAPWAEGTAGVGLVRLYGDRYLEDVKNKEAVKLLLQETVQKGFGYNHSLAAGDLGSLEFILQASAIFDDEVTRQLLIQATAVVYQSIKSNGPLCGVPFKVETPGLLNGLAGIGYGLLRLAHPTKVPSVLLLEPPEL